MKSIERFILSLAFACLFPALLAAQAPAKKPGAGDIVIITRVSIDPLPDFDFFSAYNDPGKAKDGFEPYATLSAVGVKLKKANEASLISGSFAEEKGQIGKMVGFRFEPDGTGDFYLMSFSVPLADCGDMMISLPVRSKVRLVPESQYLYVGSLSYTLEGDYLRIKSTQVNDEFDAAKSFVRAQYGDAAAESLVRVPLVLGNLGR